jgi:hypothetical protein
MGMAALAGGWAADRLVGSPCWVRADAVGQRLWPAVDQPQDRLALLRDLGGQRAALHHQTLDPQLLPLMRRHDRHRGLEVEVVDKDRGLAGAAYMRTPSAQAAAQRTTGARWMQLAKLAKEGRDLRVARRCESGEEHDVCESAHHTPAEMSVSLASRWTRR